MPDFFLFMFFSFRDRKIKIQVRVEMIRVREYTVTVGKETLLMNATWSLDCDKKHILFINYLTGNYQLERKLR